MARLFLLLVLLIAFRSFLDAQESVIRIDSLSFSPAVETHIEEQVLEILSEDYANLPWEIPLHELANLENHCVSIMTNLGFAFVRVQLDSIAIDPFISRGIIRIYPERRYQIDSIIVQSKKYIDQQLLQEIMDIKRGQWFAPDKLEKAQNRLAFYHIHNQSRPIEVGFHDSLAWIYVYPKPARSNRFDGYLGFQPADLKGIPRLTGALNLHLFNTFGKLETFGLNWKSGGSGKQKLSAGLSLPFLLASKFGASGELDLYRRDSSYLLLNSKIAGRYTIQPGHYLELFYNFRQSRTIDSNANFSGEEFLLHLTGINWVLDRRPSIRSARQYYQMNQAIAASLDGSYWELESDFSMAITLGSNAALYSSLGGGYRHLASTENEQFRLGGASSLRGFQEEQFFSGAFATAVLEGRLLFGQQSHLHTFIDMAWIETTGWVYAPGVGISLETRAGLLSLDYAFGQYFGESFKLNSGLLHLGIQSNF